LVILHDRLAIVNSKRKKFFNGNLSAECPLKVGIFFRPVGMNSLKTTMKNGFSNQPMKYK
jgi:hypothetical protein